MGRRNSGRNEAKAGGRGAREQPVQRRQGAPWICSAELICSFLSQSTFRICTRSPIFSATSSNSLASSTQGPHLRHKLRRGRHQAQHTTTRKLPLPTARSHRLVLSGHQDSPSGKKVDDQRAIAVGDLNLQLVLCHLSNLQSIGGVYHHWIRCLLKAPVRFGFTCLASACDVSVSAARLFAMHRGFTQLM